MFIVNIVLIQNLMIITHVSLSYPSLNWWIKSMRVNAMNDELEGSRWSSRIDSTNSICSRIDVCKHELILYWWMYDKSGLVLIEFWTLCWIMLRIAYD